MDRGVSQRGVCRHAGRPANELLGSGGDPGRILWPQGGAGEAQPHARAAGLTADGAAARVSSAQMATLARFTGFARFWGARNTSVPSGEGRGQCGGQRAVRQGRSRRFVAHGSGRPTVGSVRGVATGMKVTTHTLFRTVGRLLAIVSTLRRAEGCRIEVTQPAIADAFASPGGGTICIARSVTTFATWNHAALRGYERARPVLLALMRGATKRGRHAVATACTLAASRVRTGCNCNQ